jgi:hypothetical protein
MEYKVAACKTDEFPMHVTGESKLISTNVREASKSFEDSNVLNVITACLHAKSKGFNAESDTLIHRYFVVTLARVHTSDLEGCRAQFIPPFVLDGLLKI